jgi:hypothetical protein
MWKVRRSGQSLTELAVLLIAITMAILGMHLYLRHGLQARYKGGMDYFFNKIGEQSTEKIYHQYEPYYYQAERSVSQSANIIQGYPDSSETSTSTQSGWSSAGGSDEAD